MPAALALTRSQQSRLYHTLALRVIFRGFWRWLGVDVAARFPPSSSTWPPVCEPPSSPSPRAAPVPADSPMAASPVSSARPAG